ncbi:MAG: hypothetical protein ACI828_000700 [Flavobacteriales bacterium]|jgi:hypothetical protein
MCPYLGIIILMVTIILPYKGGMKNHHVHVNEWNDIGQQFSIFPDGKIVIGRSIDHSPTCIFCNNSGALCTENIGFFDLGEDTMDLRQQERILRLTAVLCKRFNIPVTEDLIVYHHWFDLSTGALTNGGGTTKSCPGTNLFGGNTVANSQQQFLPLVNNLVGSTIDGVMPVALLRYGSVTVNTLNIRSGQFLHFHRLGKLLLELFLECAKFKTIGIEYQKIKKNGFLVIL